MRSFSLTNLGSGWVVCTPSSGAAFTRRVGPSTANSECEVERTGKLSFYTGYVPPVGEQIAVTYRAQGRAVRARRQLCQSIRACRRRLALHLGLDRLCYQSAYAQLR